MVIVLNALSKLGISKLLLGNNYKERKGNTLETTKVMRGNFLRVKRSMHHQC